MEEIKPLGGMKDDIQSKLDKKLGPEYISKRVGFGSSRVAYIEGWKAINLANQIFGYNGWSTEVKSVVIDFLDERQGKYSIGCTAIVRVTLSAGTYREDIGYGTVENERRKPAAFERAKKSAVTDALKRSLRGFGNALGNCLYDKDFLSKIDKVKFDPPDFDEGNLFRPSDEISEMSRANTMEQNSRIGQDPAMPPFKKRQLLKISNPNPVPKIEARDSPVPPSIAAEHQAVKPTAAVAAANDRVEQVNINNAAIDSFGKDDELLDDSFMFSDDLQDDDLVNMADEPASNHRSEKQVNVSSTVQPNINAPVAFVTAKAATSLQESNTIAQENMFDPKFKSQSVKHTVDQTTSKHIPASVLKGKDLSREKLYEKFAPKGKQIDTNNGSLPKEPETTVVPKSNAPEPNNENSSHTINHVTAEATATAPTVSVPTHPVPVNPLSPPVEAPKFAPPASIIHPNTKAQAILPPRPIRREVGRPKVNYVSMQKPTK